MKNNNIEDYALILLSKLQEALEENKKSKALYDTLLKNSPPGYEDAYCDWLNNLNDLEYKIYNHYGYMHSKAEINRLRIELNKSLLELYK